MFPALRFTQAGASADEVAVLQREFDALPEAAQAPRLEHLATLAEGDLIEWLAAWRLHYDELRSEGDGELAEGAEAGSPTGVEPAADAGHGEGEADVDPGGGQPMVANMGYVAPAVPVGDGITDDAPAFQALQDAAAEAQPSEPPAVT